jgi:pimeloyl-ACP methyl ester carboxylesterase
MPAHPLRLSLALLTLFVASLTPAGAAAQDAPDWLLGDWTGTLDAGSQQIQIVYRLSTNDEGTLTGTMDVPSQGATGLPLQSITINGAEVSWSFQVPGGGSYEGARTESGNTIKGAYTQGPQSFPMTLSKQEETEGPRRPQEPEPPFPYDVEDVALSNSSAGIELAGTLTMPDGNGPFPSVVLVSGAGPHDRNGSMFGHQPFLVLADHLTREGIAVLRLDERGVGESGGNFEQATVSDLASDVTAAIAFLGRHPKTAEGRIGIVGHSQGGRTALMAARSSSDAAFLVLLASPALPGNELLDTEAQQIASATGLPVQTVSQFQETLVTILAEEPDPEGAAPRLREAAQAALDALGPESRTARVEQVFRHIVQQYNRPQTRFLLQHDPRPTLETLPIPVLALFGGKDQQVEVRLHASEMQAALNRGGGGNGAVETIPGLNHLFQEAQTGAPAEYARIEQTLSPTLLTRTASWIQNLNL